MTMKGGDKTIVTSAARSFRPAAALGSARSALAIRLGGLITLLLLAACASHKPTVPPSEGHLSKDTVPVTPAEEKILPPVTVSDFVPMPKPQAKLPTYSVVVTEVPVKELLFALAGNTRAHRRSGKYPLPDRRQDHHRGSRYTLFQNLSG